MLLDDSGTGETRYLLADDAARVLEHATLNLVGSSSPQVLARQATAWLAVNADGLEANTRRTFELARFCEAFDFMDSAERELFLPEAWPAEQLFALRERAMSEMGEQGWYWRALKGSGHPESLAEIARSVSKPGGRHPCGGTKPCTLASCR